MLVAPDAGGIEKVQVEKLGQKVRKARERYSCCVSEMRRCVFHFWMIPSKPKLTKKKKNTTKSLEINRSLN